MKTLLQILSWLAFSVLVLLPALFLNGTLGLERVKLGMGLATLVWFLTAPFWMKRAE